MNNVFVYIEIEGTQVAEVSQELLTKGRKLANTLGVQLHAVVAGTDIKGKVESQILPYGVDKLFCFDGPALFPYTSAPHTSILVNLFKEEEPQICLMGATVIGRDLGPRVSSSLTSGLTADCTELEIGEYDEKKSGKHWDQLLYQIGMVDSQILSDHSSERLSDEYGSVNSFNSKNTIQFIANIGICKFIIWSRLSMARTIPHQYFKIIFKA